MRPLALYDLCLIVPLLSVTATLACDCREHWNAVEPSSETVAPMIQGWTVPFSTWEALQEQCYDMLLPTSRCFIGNPGQQVCTDTSKTLANCPPEEISGKPVLSLSPQCHDNPGAYPITLQQCDGILVDVDRTKAMFVYNVIDYSSPPALPVWASTLLTFNRWNWQPCYNLTFDPFYYYFYSGFKEQIDEFAPMFQLPSSGPGGSCYFAVYDYINAAQIACPEGMVSQCDLQNPCVDPMNATSWTFFNKPDIIRNVTEPNGWTHPVAIRPPGYPAPPSEGGVDPNSLPTFVAAVTNFYTQIGFRYGYGINALCPIGLTMPYDPQQSCAVTLNGCVDQVYNEASGTFPEVGPCSGNGYCEPYTGQLGSLSFTHGASWCHCQKLGDLPPYIAPEDFTMGVANFGGSYQYVGYACQSGPGASKTACSNIVEGTTAMCNNDASLCQLTGGGESDLGEYGTGAGILNNGVGTSQVFGNYLTWTLACNCESKQASKGTYCDVSTCLTVHNTSDPSFCNIHNNGGYCGPGTTYISTGQAILSDICQCNQVINGGAGFTGQTCATSDIATANAGCFHNGALCNNIPGACMFTEIPTETAYCDCSKSGGQATGTWCETVICNSSVVVPTHGLCSANFKWTSDYLNCFSGPAGCTPGTNCYQIFQSSNLPGLAHCDVDTCSNYGGGHAVLGINNSVSCSCPASGSYVPSGAPSNYVMAPLSGTSPRVSTSYSSSPLCFPRCYNDCSLLSGDGYCAVTVVKSGLQMNPTTQPLLVYANCACRNWNTLTLPVNCVPISHAQLPNGTYAGNIPASSYSPGINGTALIELQAICQNGGSCVGIGCTKCLCTTQSYGSNCQTLYCHNGGTFYPASGTCSCPVPYTPATLCANNTCQLSYWNNAIVNGLCSCVPPYIPSAKAAIDCNNNTCGPNGVPTPGSLMACACSAGWTNSGSCPGGGNCIYCNTRIDPCKTPGLCQNGGTCFSSEDLSAFLCQCTSAFAGVNCQAPSDVCPAQNPCQNGGVCQNAANLTSHWCNCPTGYTQPICATIINYCTSQPCLNGGSCQPQLNGYTCSCPQSFSGPMCQTYTPPPPACASSSTPCQNGGTCLISSSGGYTCSCVATYTGTNCQTYVAPINSCVPSPCNSGGTCIQTGQSFSCSCPLWFSGLICQTYLPPCANSPCGTHGTCGNNATSGSYNCVCQTGWVGLQCQNKVDACASSPCGAHGTCFNNATTLAFNCVCEAYWTGTLCSVNSPPPAATQNTTSTTFWSTANIAYVAGGSVVAVAGASYGIYYWLASRAKVLVSGSKATPGARREDYQRVTMTDDTSEYPL